MNDLVKSPTGSGLLLPSELAKTLQNTSKKRGFIPTDKQLSDRWGNTVSGFGMPGVDPQTNTAFYPEDPLDQNTLDFLYRDSWLARRVVETIPKLAIRKGFTIKPSSEELAEVADKVHKKMKSWDENRNTYQHAVQGQLYGDAAKVFFLEDRRAGRRPFDKRYVQDIEDIHVADRYLCSPMHFYPARAGRKRKGKPMVWQVLVYESAYSMSLEAIHETKMSWLGGSYLTPKIKLKNQGFNDSVLQVMHETLRSQETSIQAIGGVIQDFVLKVVQFENMDELLDDEEGLQEMEKRLLQLDTQSNMHETVAVGVNEDFKKIATPVQGLVELVVLLMDQVAAASNIPKSTLFGNLTGTLGSSSGYHDRANLCELVEEFQTSVLTPSLQFEYKLACWLNGIDPDLLQLSWLNIRDMGAKEDSQTEKSRAETMNISTEIAKKWQESMGDGNANIKDLTLEIYRLIEQRAA